MHLHQTAKPQVPKSVENAEDARMDDLPRIAKYLLIAAYLTSTNSHTSNLCMFGCGLDEKQRKLRVNRVAPTGGVVKVGDLAQLCGVQLTLFVAPATRAWTEPVPCGKTACYSRSSARRKRRGSATRSTPSAWTATSSASQSSETLLSLTASHVNSSNGKDRSSSEAGIGDGLNIVAMLDAEASVRNLIIDACRTLFLEDHVCSVEMDGRKCDRCAVGSFEQDRTSSTHWPRNEIAPLTPESLMLARSLNAINGRFSTGTFAKVAAHPSQRANMDLISTRLARPSTDPQAPHLTLKKQLEDVMALDGDELEAVATDEMRMLLASTLKKIEPHEQPHNRSATNDAAASSSGQSTRRKRNPEADTQKTLKLFEAFTSLAQCSPITLEEQITLHQSTYNASLSNEEREMKAWAHGFRSFAAPPGPRTAAHVQGYWRQGFADVFKPSQGTASLIASYPTKVAEADAESTFAHVVALDTVMQEWKAESLTELLLQHILSLMAAVEFAHEYDGLSLDDKDRVARRRFISHPDHTAKFAAAAANDYDTLIDTQHKREYLLWKDNVFGKETTGRNRARVVYDELGPHALLDTSFSPARLHAGWTSTAYPKLVKHILQAPRDRVDKAYGRNRAATLGIISALDTELARKVRVFLNHFPSKPALNFAARSNA
uniref:Uncharacterized protein n=1 Tax=Mycena chlorophos TaxID=658473 RepID=A0ABQ0L0S3_MYCCL|nr:predicted protein [Mycena chlorophos]